MGMDLGGARGMTVGLQPARLSVSSISSPDTPLADDIALAGALGLGGLGLWGYKLAGEKDVPQRLADAGLEVSNLVPRGNSIFPYALSRDPAAPTDRVDRLIERLTAAAELSPRCVVCITGPRPPDMSEERAREVAAALLTQVADAAAELGLVVALEPIHPRISASFSLVSTIEDAVSLLAQAGSDRVRVLLDTWHVGDSPDLAGQLARHAKRIVGVHVADRVPGWSHWAQRAFPGEGAREVPGLIDQILAAGFGGLLDVEIFSDDGRYGKRVRPSLWELGAAEIFRRCVGGVVAMGPGKGR